MLSSESRYIQGGVLDVPLTHFSLLLLCSQLAYSKDEIYHYTGRTMGTSYNVKFRSFRPLDFQKNFDALLVEINRQMSTYIPDSEISLFNKGEANKASKISPEFAFVVAEAKSIYSRTNGAFEPTIGELVNLWGFGPKDARKNSIPKRLGLCKGSGWSR